MFDQYSILVDKYSRINQENALRCKRVMEIVLKKMKERVNEKWFHLLHKCVNAKGNIGKQPINSLSDGFLEGKIPSIINSYLWLVGLQMMFFFSFLLVSILSTVSVLSTYIKINLKCNKSDRIWYHGLIVTKTGKSGLPTDTLTNN